MDETVRRWYDAGGALFSLTVEKKVRSASSEGTNSCRLVTAEDVARRCGATSKQVHSWATIGVDGVVLHRIKHQGRYYFSDHDVEVFIHRKNGGRVIDIRGGEAFPREVCVNSDIDAIWVSLPAGHVAGRMQEYKQSLSDRDVFYPSDPPVFC